MRNLIARTGCLIAFLLIAGNTAGAKSGLESTWHEPSFLLARKNPGKEHLLDPEPQLKYQISVKFKLAEQNPYFVSYSQLSLWDIGAPSGPFRESNYNPAIWAGWEWKDSILSRLDMGYEHQSNGQVETVQPDGTVPTRSWERLFVDPTWQISPTLFVRTKVWYAAFLEENPAFRDYYGFGELRLRWTPQDWFDLRFKGRRGSKGGQSQVNLFIPGLISNLHWVFQYFQGYGESLIDIHGAQDPLQKSTPLSPTLGIGLAVSK